MKKLLSIILAGVVLLCFSGCAVKDANKETKPSQETPTLKITHDAAYNSFDQSVIDVYESLCNAVLNYETELRVNTGIAGNALDLFNTSFPLSVLVKNVTMKEDKSGVVIEYANPKSVHDEKIQAFNAKIKAIMQQCYNNTTNKGVYAVNAYHYVASKVSLERTVNLTCYDAIMNGNSNEAGCVQMLEYLLLQAEIPAYHIIAQGLDGSAVYLTEATLGAQNYYFDVMGEKAFTQGRGITMFGLTVDELKTYGLSSPMTYLQEAPPDAFDVTFDICRKAASWKIEGANLMITTNENDAVKIELTNE